MSIVSEVIERQQHNCNVARAKRSVWRQLEWDNLSHLYVEPPRRTARPRDRPKGKRPMTDSLPDPIRRRLRGDEIDPQEFVNIAQQSGKGV
ncbi:hypothetical protein [Lacipirellula parvula]|uniref:Uncharacterized protein n=1 Tax=Lacipirellula parvula TaxID=2650471 RepID=A0A5K7X9L9_9BACT|nr:hypothetical protein [Lacipirellula parvula]BBO33228.1 hypothetical protein PLANPX_2840 [Lacipirellula parvula]